MDERRSHALVLRAALPKLVSLVLKVVKENETHYRHTFISRPIWWLSSPACPGRSGGEIPGNIRKPGSAKTAARGVPISSYQAGRCGRGRALPGQSPSQGRYD